MKKAEAIVLIILLILIKGLISGQDDSSYYPGDTWRTSTAEAQGMDSGYLVKMMDDIQSNNLNIHSMIIIRHGYVVMEAYREPFGKDNIHAINSCTKNVASALIGIALREGYIKSIDQRVVDIFSNLNIKNLDDNKRAMTIKHLLTESSGINFTGLYPDGYLNAPDWTRFYLDQPMAAPPGKVFHYDSAGVNLLMAILQKTSGLKNSDFADKFLFKPIGITKYYWQSDPQGLNLGGMGLALTPMEMARFGYLYLKKGLWNGKRVIPADWVEASLSSQIKPPAWFSKDKGHGYLWWELQSGGFAGIGHGGQYIIVMPGRDMVIVINSGLSDKTHWQTVSPLIEYINKSVVSGKSIVENPEKQAELSEAIRNLANPASKTAIIIPETAQRISGKKYILNPNSWNLKTLMVTFNGKDECIAELGWPGFLFFDYRYEIAIGLDGKYWENRFAPDFRQRELSRGKWVSNDTFVIEYYRPWADSSKILCVCQIDHDRFSMTLESTTGEWLQEFTGKMEQQIFLFEAASRGDYNFIKSYRGYIDDKDDYGKTAMMYAADALTVKTLIAAGADINSVDEKGWTALMYAVKEGKTDAVKELIEDGSDINAKDNYGRTAIFWAKNEAIVNLFKNAKAGK